MLRIKKVSDFFFYKDFFFIIRCLAINQTTKPHQYNWEHLQSIHPHDEMMRILLNNV